MRSILLCGILAATTAFTAACGSSDATAPAIAPASVQRAVSADARFDGVTTTWRSVEQYVWLSCANDGAGETVHVTGELRYAVRRNQDSSGVTHLTITSNTSGLTGVGLTSGAVFRGTMAERVNSRAEDDLNVDVRTADAIRFVSPGGTEAYALMVTSHFVVDQGTYVLTEQTWQEVCR